MDALSLLLANAVAASLLAVVVALVCALLRRPAFASRGWLLVLLKLLAPPLIAVPVLWQTKVGDEVQNREDPSPSAYASPAAHVPPVYVSRSGEPSGEMEDASATASEPSSVAPLPRGLDNSPATASLQTAGAVSSNAAASAAKPVAATWSNSISIRNIALAVWLSGTILYWGVAFIRIVRFRRRARSSESVAHDDLLRGREIAARLGVHTVPSIACVAANISPMVWMSIRGPCILLPRRLWQRLNPSQRTAVLAHEMAHVRRGDLWVRFIELFALGLYWWFPVAWLARRQLRRAEEACCDAWVVWALPDQAPAYAEALVETAAFVSSPRYVPLASGGAAQLSTLKRRLSMILQNPPAHRLRWPLGLALAAFALALIPWRPTIVEAQQPPATSAPKSPAPKTPKTQPPRDLPSNPKLPAAPAPPLGALPIPPGWTTRAGIEDLEEEIALLEAHLETRRAMLRGAEAELKSQTARLDDIKRGVAANAATRSELVQAEMGIEKARANLDVKAAELKEHDVKLAFAKRRLARVQSAPPGPRGPANAPSDPQPRGSGAANKRETSVPPDASNEIRAIEAKLKELEALAKQADAANSQLVAELDMLQKKIAAEQERRKAIEAERNAVETLLREYIDKAKAAERKPR